MAMTHRLKGNRHTAGANVFDDEKQNEILEMAASTFVHLGWREKRSKKKCLLKQNSFFHHNYLQVW